jgi:para-aminobenzoate synthetase
VRTLLIDNHDSYTYNLFQLIAEVNGQEPEVVSNDSPRLVSLDLDEFDNLVISPGPGRPGNARDEGHVTTVLRTARCPVLGVCFGHQLLAYEAGGDVELAPRPRHGYVTTVTHNGDDLFAGVPTSFQAVRYHSLCVRDPLPDELVVTARAEDGVVMGIRHRRRPQWGVQFHPESIATEHGRRILENFRDLTPLSVRGMSCAVPRSSEGMNPGRRPMRTGEQEARPAAFRLETRVLPRAIETEAIFREIFGSAKTSFWLDSSRAEPGLSRFSFLGDAMGPYSEVLTYRVNSGVVTVTGPSQRCSKEVGDIFSVLDERLRARRVEAPDLPFEFTSGYVGYFGYEMKAECGGQVRHRSDAPDAAWIFADRFVAVDHLQQATYVVALHRGDPPSRRDAGRWVAETSRRIVDLAHDDDQEPVAGWHHEDVLADYLGRSREQYHRDIAVCHDNLVQGESYEICLTNKLHIPFADEELSVYCRLRRVNPAPYGAFIRIGEAGLAILGSSPECFLRIDRSGEVESKPIKGTARRGDDPAEDARLAEELATGQKTRAENLMILDLLRNDLGRVCEIGSVTVPTCMAVESYATVHQLVSTVRGQLKPGVGPVSCVRHCFPGGSMTGAPKERTMEIIDSLETEARGVYSGALGFFGLAGGAELSIVIRTAVRRGAELTVGAGGAIVLDSDPTEEYDEMLLKAMAPLRAVGTGLNWAEGVA